METNVTSSLKKDLSFKNFYNFEEEEEDDDDDQQRHAEVLKYYQQQYEKHNQNTSSSKVDKVIVATNTNKRKYQNNDSKDYHEDDDSGEIEEQSYKNVKRVRRQAAREIISYEWLKNDNSLISVNNSDESVTRDDYTLFSNGTIKFMSNNSTTGVYKCKVKYWYTEKDIEIGPAISMTTKVELAGEFLDDYL